MKRIFLSFTALLLFASLLLTGCSTTLPKTTASTSESEASGATETVTNPQNETVETIEHTDDDGVIDILIIGNSFSTYFPDELYGVAKAAGVEMKIRSVYYSGCYVSWHFNFLAENKSEYTLYTYQSHFSSHRKAVAKVSLNTCLADDTNWDVISLQQHFSPLTALTYDAASESIGTYPNTIYKYMRNKIPSAATSKFYWFQTWSYQVGYQAPIGRNPADYSDEEKVLSTATQTTGYENIRKVSHDIADSCGVDLIPSGDAWQIARANPVVGDILCNQADGSVGDFYHDGEAGGQYLNACVWFEVLTKKSCIGNTFRPYYGIDEQVVEALQQAAHEAVVAIYGEDYYESAQ